MKIDQFIIRKTDTEQTRTKTVVKKVTRSENTVQPSTSVHSDTVQSHPQQNTGQYSEARKCTNTQLGDISETHLVETMLDPVVNARAEPECLDRSRDHPNPIVPTPHTTFTFTAQPVAPISAENVTNNINFLLQDQLSQNPDPESSRICNNEKIM